MTGMLASVNSVIEAKSILDLGVDIIDIKNPREGALGALETSAIKDIVKTVAGQTLTSATIGDIKSDDPNLPETILTMARTGVDYVKVGLFEIEPSEYFIEKITEAAKNGIKLVIVVFAENYKSIELIAPLFSSLCGTTAQ